MYGKQREFIFGWLHCKVCMFYLFLGVCIQAYYYLSVVLMNLHNQQHPYPHSFTFKKIMNWLNAWKKEDCKGGTHTKTGWLRLKIFLAFGTLVSSSS